MLARLGQRADSCPEPAISAEFAAPAEFTAPGTVSAEFMAPVEFTAPVEFAAAEEYASPADDGDTLELEISAEDLIGLWSAGAAERRQPTSNAPTTRVLATSPDFGKRAHAAIGKLTGRGPLTRIAASLVITFALIVSGTAAYRATEPNPPQPARTDNPAATQARPPEPKLAQAQKPPVRIRNPFDRSEVFEFPPGTSRRKARQAVANLLLERARDRHTRRGRNADGVRYGAAGSALTRR
jgi:hypothetical protein